MELMTDEEKLVRVWRLFRQIKHRYNLSYPELTQFEDGSGSLIGNAYELLVDWGDFDEAIDKLEQYLSER
jgi:hypothetical protein